MANEYAPFTGAFLLVAVMLQVIVSISGDVM